MAGAVFTKRTDFTFSNGGSYSGSKATAAGVGPPEGNDVDQYDLEVLGGAGTITVDSHALASKARFQGVGFTARMTALNANPGTPALTIKLKTAGPIGADLTYVLHDGEAIAWDDSAFLTAVWTSITVDADALSDFILQGALGVNYV